jgi:signal transduction histidine kinase
LVGALRWHGFAWLVFVTCAVAAVGLSQYSRHEFARRSADRFGYLVERQRELLTDRINDYQRVLRGGAGLFAASGNVTRAEWHRYVELMELDASLPGIQGTGFAQLISAQDKVAHEAAIRAEGFPLYKVYPDGVRERYGVIIYLEPFAGRNLRAFGYDMYSEPVRHEAMDRARDTGEPALSGKVRLVQETNVDVQPGFLIYVPVYANGMPTTTIEQRRAAIRGFAFSPFRSVDLIESLYHDPRRDVEVEIYDGPRTSENLLYQSHHAPREAQHVVEQTLAIAGRPWTVRFQSSAEFERRRHSSQPDLILFGGLMMSLLLLGAILNDARHNRRLEQQVRERTRELEKARDEAESASRAKSAFLATVSHELRTPLNAIIGFSTILLDDSIHALPAEQRRQLQIVNESGRHLLDLIKDILDISSIEAGQLIVHVEVVNLSRLLSEQVESVRTLAADRRLELRLEPAAYDVDVLADAVRLRQVVRNLLSNAIKFTDHGTVTVQQRVVGDMVRVEVQDTGIGIASGELESLFYPFERIGDRNGQLRPGTGLGLAISRRLVESMDGSIGCTSVQGKGSMFWFTLPLARHGVERADPV